MAVVIEYNVDCRRVLREPQKPLERRTRHPIWIEMMR